MWVWLVWVWLVWVWLVWVWLVWVWLVWVWLVWVWLVHPARSLLACSLLVQALPLGVPSGAACPAVGFMHPLVDHRMCTRPVPADGAGAADDQIASERTSRSIGRARRRRADDEHQTRGESRNMSVPDRRAHR